MTIDNLIALGQLIGLAGVVWQGGRLVQKFEDHIVEDNRRFAILEHRAGIVQPLRRPAK